MSAPQSREHLIERVQNRVRDLGTVRLADVIGELFRLEPPQRHEDDDPEEYAALTDAWLMGRDDVLGHLAAEIGATG
jgi:hypothetical protein